MTYWNWCTTHTEFTYTSVNLGIFSKSQITHQLPNEEKSGDYRAIYKSKGSISIKNYKSIEQDLNHLCCMNLIELSFSGADVKAHSR
jgi:hypothetical protein